MPAPHVAELLRKLELCRIHEITRDETGDVRDAEILTRHVAAITELAIEQAQELERARLVGLAPLRNLMLHFAHRRVQVTEHGGHGLVEVELEPAVPHFD